jgi:2-amino-4-hydroxy-6-hydroxymethyldihydropteridine diphosphokinase
LRGLAAALGPLVASSLYRTVPDSPIPQPDFLNAAAVGATRLPPDAVLAVGKLLERRAGRRRSPRYAPRPLDVDLLLYGELRSPHPELTLPHPHLRDRRFVLEPLADVAPDRPVPPDGRTVGQLFAAVAGQPDVERVGWQGSPP